ncbi:MAG: putative ABC-transport protein inner rane component, partial [Hyphomicrobiales bacterium]|nr:putative ABC-transport protein inner rane component [Hyphomicrobiales bacterium]
MWRSTANYAKRDQRLAWLLLVPAAAMVVTVMIIPLGFALFASLFRYSLGQEDKMVFVFLGNYAKFFTDPVALHSLLNTFVFTVISLALGLSIGVGIAVVLRDLNRPVANFLRAIFAMPILISPIIVS